MAKLYHVDIARHAARADAKWVDNLLSHFEIAGVESSRQGSARRISACGILHIALVRILTREPGLSAAGAVDLATRLLADDSPPPLPLNSYVELRFDRVKFEQDVERLTAEAVESVTPARRGRPRARANG